MALAVPAATTVGDMSPLADTTPPLTGDMSPLANTTPPLTGDMPPLADTTPPLTGDMPPLADATPPLTGDMPPLADATPPLTGDMPPLADATPPLTGDMPPLADTTPPLTGDMASAPAAIAVFSHTMPLWNNATWNAPGTFWGPVSPPTPPIETRQRNKTKHAMKRQRYYPAAIGDQGNWNGNFADKLPGYQTALTLSALQVSSGVADARYLQYCLSFWLTDVRTFSLAATQAVEVLSNGSSSGTYAMPVFTPPPLPAGDPAAVPPILPTVPVTAGALNRIFDLVQIIKRSPGYTEAIGSDLGIVGEEDSTEHPAPEFTLKTEQGMGCHCVKVRYKKFGHYAVAVYSRRGNGGWELLGISSDNPYEDERPLMVAGQPEVREYKMRFWDAGAENGDWTDVASTTVSI